MQQRERMHLLSRIMIAGGLVFFEEYKGTEPHELLIIYTGIALMISAMVTIAFCRFYHCSFVVWPGLRHMNHDTSGLTSVTCHVIRLQSNRSLDNQ